MLPKNVLKQVANVARQFDREECTESRWNKHLKEVAPPEYFEARRVYTRNRLASVFSRDGVTKKWSALEHTYSSFDECQADGWVLVQDFRTPAPKLSEFLKQ